MDLIKMNEEQEVKAANYYRSQFMSYFAVDGKFVAVSIEPTEVKLIYYKARIGIGRLAPLQRRWGLPYYYFYKVEKTKIFDVATHNGLEVLTMRHEGEIIQLKEQAKPPY